MRLLKNITIEDLNNMSRRELLARLEARVRALKNQDSKTRQATAMQEAFEDSM